MFSTRKLASMTAMVGSFLALAAAPAFAEGAIKVECYGNCSAVSLQEVCDSWSPGTAPVAVACDDTATPGSVYPATVWCGGAQCSPYGTMVGSDSLGAYCADNLGNDAVVTCR